MKRYTKKELKEMPEEGRQLYRKLLYLHEREELCKLSPLQKKVLVHKRRIATEELEAFGY